MGLKKMSYLNECLKQMDHCKKLLTVRDKESAKIKNIKETLDDLLFVIRDVNIQPLRFYVQNNREVLLDSYSEDRLKTFNIHPLTRLGVVVERYVSEETRVSIRFVSDNVVQKLKKFFQNETNVVFI